MSIAKEVISLKRKIDNLKEKKIKNDAMKESVLKNLKAKYGFDSIEEAQAGVERLKIKHGKEVEKLENDYDKFIEEFGEKLGINR